MEMSGERTINAPRAAVWAALNDPEVLKACISGCQEMEKTSDTSFVATVVQKVGPVKAKFTGEVELSDIVEGESYRITGKGKGGAAGGASGGAAVVLADVDGGTHLTYEAEAKVTGKIAQLGSRLISGFAKRMADDFFTKFQENVEGGGEAGGAAAQEGAEEGASDGGGVAAVAAGAAAATAGMPSAAAVVDQANQVATEMGDTAKAALDGASAAIEDATAETTSKVNEAVGGIVDDIEEAISNADTGRAGEIALEAEEASKGVASNLGDAIDNAHEAVTDAVSDVVDDVTEAISNAEPTKKSFWKRLFGG